MTDKAKEAAILAVKADPSALNRLVEQIAGAIEQSKTAIDQTRGWPEDAKLENGNYENICSSCGAHFIGHKRRLSCRVCAGLDPLPSNSQTGLAPAGVVMEVEPKPRAMLIVDETGGAWVPDDQGGAFRALFDNAPEPPVGKKAIGFVPAAELDATQSKLSQAVEALETAVRELDNGFWICPHCKEQNTTSDTDIAAYLRNTLSTIKPQEGE